MDDKTSDPPLSIDPALQSRLEALAARSGVSVTDLALSVLRAHADEQERLIAEFAEDEERWQRYLAGGQTVPFETVRGKLSKLATEAARKAEPQ